MLTFKVFLVAECTLVDDLTDLVALTSIFLYATFETLDYPPKLFLDSVRPLFGDFNC